MTAPLDTSIPFPIGTRVKYSSKAIEDLQLRGKMLFRTGTVTGESYSQGSRVVLWDGLRTKETIGMSFLEIIA